MTDSTVRRRHVAAALAALLPTPGLHGGYAPEVDVPQGAEEASGPEELTRVVRDQIRNGADWIKIYADSR